MSVVVEDSGLLTVVQDLGRPARGHLGVSPSGAFDRVALRQANRLLGNDGGAAALEVLGGVRIRAEDPTTVAVTGAAGTITVDGVLGAYGRAVPLRGGQVLVVGPPVAGLRTYVGVSGGFVVDAELGSRSTDTLSGLGPAPVRRGDTLRTGPRAAAPAVEDVLPLTRGDLTLDVALGPRDDWFTASAVRLLLEAPWQVGSASDRIGVRLSGPRLERSRPDELPSEPCVRGSIQVASDGQPIVFGPDHPVTGGYPVIAVVLDRHTDLIAQAAPGTVVRFGSMSRPRRPG